MKLPATVYFFLVIYLMGCKSRSAFDYSQMIVKIETELAADIVAADKKVAFYVNANQSDSAAIITGQMEAMAQSKLKQVQDLKAPNVEEGENFKQAAVRYFAYLKTVYTSLNKLTRATSDEEKEAEQKKLNRIIADKDNATKALQEAQRKFAAANNFRIEKAGSE